MITDIYVSSDYISLEIDSDYKIKGNYYIDEDYSLDLSLGDEVIIYGEIYLPSSNTNPNLFSYRDYLKSENIYYLVNIESYEKISDNTNIFYSIKNYIMSLINNNLSYKYLYAFVLGDMRYIDSDVESAYQELGISHLYSVSGMHISIISGIILNILKKIRVSEEIRSFITCLFVVFFMFLVSLCPSVLRSGIFFILITINNIYYFHIKPINLLLITVSMIMFFNPYIIYNNGFLYSSIITGSLIVFSPLINKYKNYISKLFMTSLISFLFSFPLSIYSYYQINILSIIYNLIFVPLVSIIIFPLSLVCLFLPFLSIFLEIFIKVMEELSILCTSIDSNIIFMKPSLLVLLLYYLLIFIMVYFRKKLLYFIFFICLLIHYNYNVLFSSNYILMIDIGQGDSILMHSSKYNILVDTGGVSYGESNIAKNTLIPLFKSLGIRKIDYLFLSHGDYDHLGESINLINDFSVGKVYFNEGELNNNEREVISLLNKKKIDYFISYEGNYYEIGDYKLYSVGTDLSDENDSSMILYGNIYNYSFLLTGDSSIKSEEVLLSKYNISNIDILKVGHHGSKTSTGEVFLKKINPKYALISAGRDNKFNHPNDEVIELLNKYMIDTYITNRDGAILIKVKKEELEISKERSNE